MADIDKEFQDLRREVVEARNLVIKTDSLLKSLHGELKTVAERQKNAERRGSATGATAYILFAAVAILGAYMYARGEMRGRIEELAHVRQERDAAKKSIEDFKAVEQETREESARALDLFEKIGSADEDKRNRAISEVASLQPKHLTALEVRALKDKAATRQQAAAIDAYDNGKQSFARREFRQAAEELARYITLVTGKPDDYAFFLLGQSRHALKDFKGAVEPLQAYLKAAPNAKSADYATLILGESLAESGEKEKAIQLYKTSADKFWDSPHSGTMRARARRIENELKNAATAGDAATPPAPGAAAPAAPAGQR